MMRFSGVGDIDVVELVQLARAASTLNPILKVGLYSTNEECTRWVQPPCFSVGSRAF